MKIADIFRLVISPVFLGAFGLVVPTLAYGQAGASCPDHIGGYGPFDYNTAPPENINIVEGAHFTSKVERLIAGNAGYLGQDIDYTIRAFPNHRRALDSLSRLGQRNKTNKPSGAKCTIEGYFERGIRYQPNDGKLRMAYGMHFMRWNQPKKAMEQFLAAEKLEPDDPNLLYNLGLIYFDRKEYDRAKEYAIKAYDNGFPPEIAGLKNKLKKVGKWTVAEQQPQQAPQQLQQPAPQ